MRDKAVVMWAKKGEGDGSYMRRADGQSKHPPSNLNLSGFLGGVLCVPDHAYGTFLEKYAASLEAGDPQFLTECCGAGSGERDRFRWYVDLDIVGIEVDLDKIARATYECALQFVPEAAARLDCVLCAAQPVETDKGIKVGVHTVMPQLVVNQERALDMRGALIAKLHEVCGGADMQAWVEACDASVYNDMTSGLRMIGAHKMRNCPMCKNKTSKKEACCGTGKQDLGRPYTVHGYYKRGVRDEHTTSRLRANLALAVRYCSIRIAAGQTNPATPQDIDPQWKRFVGCPSMRVDLNRRTEAKALKGVLEEDKREAPQEFKDDAKGTSQFLNKQKLQVGDPKIKVMSLALGRLHQQYEDLEAREVFYLPEQESYLFKVWSSYCLNKRDDHTSATVYFYFTPDAGGGSFHQRCWSRKETTKKRVDGCCRCWRSGRKTLSKGEALVLWPNGSRRSVKRPLPDSSSSKAPSDA